MKDGERPPIRVVTRLLAQMQTGVVSAGVRMVDGDLDRFMIYSLVLRQTMNGSGGSPISALAIANSLSRPYETVRRHVQALIALGFCTRVEQGIIAPPTALSCPQVSALITLTHDWLVRFIHDLGALSVPLPQPRGQGDYDPSIGMSAAADILLSVADGNRGMHRDGVGLVLFSIVLCANTRGYTLDPKLARHYRDETRDAPEALRHPVRTSVLARVSGMTETTVRRRVNAMLEDGVLDRSARGLMVREKWLNGAGPVQISRTTYQSCRRVLERVAAAGFPIGDPASAYLVGRPPDPSFD